MGHRVFCLLISYTGITVTPPCFCEMWEASELRVLKKSIKRLNFTLWNTVI